MAVDQRNELERMARVADMLASSHAVLRDRLARRAMLANILIMIASLWVVAMTFAEPEIASKLNPLPLKGSITIGLLGIVVFGFSIIELVVNWRGRSTQHASASRDYSSVKLNIRRALDKHDTLAADTYRGLVDRYHFVGSSAVPIPEAKFAALKKHHLTKIAISRHLDDCPAVSIWFLRFRLWCRDNFGRRNLSRSK